MPRRDHTRSTKEATPTEPQPGPLGAPAPAEVDFTPQALVGLPATFRRQFLWRFEFPEDRAAFELLGQVLHEFLFETEQHGPDPDREVFVQELEAASADLMDCANDLRTIASRDLGFGPQKRNRDLGRRAAGWADEAAGLAREIWKALSS